MLIQVVGVNLFLFYVCLEGLLGGECFCVQGDEMLMQCLLLVVCEVLDEVVVKFEEIDLIVGFVLFFDYLIENCDIMVLKIGYLLQKVFGVNCVYVFDFIDLSLVCVFYVVDIFVSDQGYCNVLVVCGEFSQGLEVDSEFGFVFVDGVLVLFCWLIGKVVFCCGVLGGDLVQEWLLLSILLNIDICQVGDVKGYFNLLV